MLTISQTAAPVSHSFRRRSLLLQPRITLVEDAVTWVGLLQQTGDEFFAVCTFSAMLLDADRLSGRSSVAEQELSKLRT
jgi:hypothetical protein